jgi:hypothetical protein
VPHLEYFEREIRNIWKVLKFDAGEGWRSVGPIMLEIKKYYRCADKSLARPTSRFILFDGENISFDGSLVICSTNIPPIMIINRVYENQTLLSL